MHVRAFADLSPSERALLVAALAGTPFERPAEVLERDLGAEELEGGATAWVAWDDGPHGLLGTISREVPEKGLLYATRAALVGDRPDARVALLRRLDEVAAGVRPRETRLGLSPFLVDRWPEVAAAGFRPIYDVLRMSAERLVERPVPPHTVERVSAGNAELWREVSNRAFFDTPNSATTSPEEVRGHLADPAFLGLLLRVDGVPVGTAHCSVRPDEVEIEGLAVLPEARGRGFGRALLQAATRVAGSPRQVLTVVDTNAEAVALYRSAGFSVDRVASRWFGRTEGPVTRSLGS